MNTAGPRSPQRQREDDHHHEQHRDALLRAVASDAPADVERARAELRDCGACTEELERFTEVQRGLDEAARAREDALRQAFDAARAGAAAPGADLVAPFLRAKLAAHAALGSAGAAPAAAGLVDAGPARAEGVRASPLRSVRSSASMRSAWPRWIAAAAAAAVLVGWLSRVWWMREEPEAFGPTLGVPKGGLVRPRGDVTEYLPFVWDVDMPPGGSYVLTIWDDATGSIDAPIRTIRHLKEPKWGEGESEEGMPEQIGWTVQSVDATGILHKTVPPEYAQRRTP